MSYPRYGDRWYKVTVATEYKRRIYVDVYGNPANAVFGAMRKVEVDRTWEPSPDEKIDIQCELLPPKPPRMTKASYTRQLRALHHATL